MKTLRASLHELAQRHRLDEAQEAQLEAVLVALAGDPVAPSAVREGKRAVDVHVADSLAALDVLKEGFAGGLPAVLTDVGSGPGFPGIALAVALPGVRVELIESQGRKCAFLERLCAAAGVDNARVVCGRVEQWREGLGASGAVTARALAPAPVVLEYAAPLLCSGGLLVDWRGRRDAVGESAAATAADELGLALREIRHVEPYPEAREHHLHVYEKVRETPPRYPRRPGVARKRPLGC